MNELNLKPCAAWTNDCQGKKDFDGRLLSISCRYWPGSESKAWNTITVYGDSVEFSNTPYGGTPSASASIILNHGIPDEPEGYNDSLEISTAEFKSETEAGVKAQVEEWCASEVNRIHRILTATQPNNAALAAELRTVLQVEDLELGSVIKLKNVIRALESK